MKGIMKLHLRERSLEDGRRMVPSKDYSALYPMR
jgi:hypothetical protein